MLETLLTHLDTAAATNGAATEAPAAEKTAEEPKKDDAAPSEVSVYIFVLLVQQYAKTQHVAALGKGF